MGNKYKFQIRILFIVFILIIALENAYSQRYEHYIDDTSVKIIGDRIEITYDLPYTLAVYGVPNRIAKYSVILLLSKDRGASFNEVHDASGAIGNDVYPGKNKKIVWRPKLGIIGDHTFKVKAITVKYDKGDFGLISTYPISKNGHPHLNIRIIGQYYDDENKLILSGMKWCKEWRDNDDNRYQVMTWSLAYGYRTINRIFSIYCGAGLGTFYAEYYDSDKEKTKLAGSFEFGVLIRVPISKKIRFYLPIEYSALTKRGSNFQTGLGILFPFPS